MKIFAASCAVIIILFVALNTFKLGMFSSEFVACFFVIESGNFPSCLIVTSIAFSILESGRDIFFVKVFMAA